MNTGNRSAFVKLIIRYFSISGKTKIGKSTRRALNGEILADEFSGKVPRELFSFLNEFKTRKWAGSNGRNLETVYYG